MLGACLCMQVMHIIPSFWLSILIGPLSAALLGIAIERALLRRTYGREISFRLLLTFAILLIPDDAVRIIWGPGYHVVEPPALLSGVIALITRPYPVYRLFLVVAGPLIGLTLWAFFQFSRWGKIIRAAAMDREMAEGIGFVPEDRRIFPDLGVMENLAVATLPARPGQNAWTEARIFDIFPLLVKLKDHKGGALSGGEQQMLSLAGALMGNPCMLLLDEPCEGLAPYMAENIGENISALKADVAILLTEQNAHFALGIADRGYVIDKGRVRYEGMAEELAANEEVQQRYLAVYTIRNVMKKPPGNPVYFFSASWACQVKPSQFKKNLNCCHISVDIKFSHLACSWYVIAEFDIPEFIGILSICNLRKAKIWYWYLYTHLKRFRINQVSIFNTQKA
jgi:ABC-type branched-subunit amino acid transport system ATPase component